MGQPAIEVKGLKEWKREIRKLTGSKEFENALKDEHQAVARKVVEASHRRAAATGRKEIMKAAETLSAGRTLKGAVVRAGGARVPWAGAAFFGTYHNRTRERRTGKYLGYNQFLEPTPGGYVIYPAIEDMRSEITRTYLEGIERVMHRAFPD